MGRIVDRKSGAQPDLHAIWGLANSTLMAALSLGVLTVYASGFTYPAVKVFVHESLR